MVKKALIATGALCALVVLMGGSTFVRAAWNTGKHELQGLKPLELKLGELEVKVSDLHKALRAKRVDVRKFEAKVAGEQRSIDEMQRSGDRLVADMGLLLVDLKSTPARARFVYAGLDYGRDEVKQDIIRKKKQHHAMAEKIAMKERSLGALKQMVVEYRQAIGEKHILAESLERKCEKIRVTIEMARLKSRFPEFGTIETKSLVEEAEALEAEAQGAIIEIKDTGIRPIRVAPEQDTLKEIESYIHSLDS